MADLHGSEQALELLKKLLTQEKPEKFDVVIVAGDVTQFGPANATSALDYAKNVVDAVRASGAECVVVHGNTDSLQVKMFLEREGVSIHNKKKIIQGSDGKDIEFVGYGGSAPTPFATSITYSEAQIYADLAKLATKDSILVTHSPPFGLPLELDKTFDLRHAGSKSVRRIIDEKRPRACVCAHVHERRGEANVLGCRVIKIAPLNEGRYCVLDLSSLQADFR